MADSRLLPTRPDSPETPGNRSLVDEPFAWPENLTHCSECGLEFPEPVTWWDDHFVEIEDASYCCTACADEFDGTAANAR